MKELLNLNPGELGITGILVIVALLFAFWGFAKGLVKMIFGILALGSGIWAGLWGYRNGESIASMVVEKPEPWMSVVIALIVGIGVFTLARTILGLLTGSLNQTKTARKLGFGFPGGILGLIMGAAVAWLATSGIRYSGGLAELSRLDRQIDSTEGTANDVPLLLRLKNWIESSQVGQFHIRHDPLNNLAKLNLAKLFVLRQSPYYSGRAATSSATREAVHARAVSAALAIGGEPLKLAQEGSFAKLLQHPHLARICEDEEVCKALRLSKAEKLLGLDP